jgi:hypothetical protein
VVLFPLAANGAEYLIEFDTLAGHSPGTGATLTQVVLQPYGWRSIGDPNGGRFLNRTGGTIRAIHLKCSTPANSLKVTAQSGGRLFPIVWVKNDGSEAYLLGGNVPSGTGAFWMRVPRNTQGEIQQCDAQRICPFTGQAFDADPAEPTDPGWTKVSSAPSPPNDRWRMLIAATPSEYRDIQAYEESTDGDHILFVTTGQLLLFEARETTVSLIPSLDATLRPVNRISLDGDDFLLWQSGTVVLRTSLTKVDKQVIGRVPK